MRARPRVTLKPPHRHGPDAAVVEWAPGPGPPPVPTGSCQLCKRPAPRMDTPKPFAVRGSTSKAALNASTTRSSSISCPGHQDVVF